MTPEEQEEEEILNQIEAQLYLKPMAQRTYRWATLKLAYAILLQALIWFCVLVTMRAEEPFGVTVLGIGSVYMTKLLFEASRDHTRASRLRKELDNA